jgi:hypothetical protein
MAKKKTATITPEVERMLLAERLIQQVADQLGQYLEHSPVKTKTGLARRLGKPESHIKGMLEGRNFTLKTLSDLAFVLGARWRIELVPGTK